MSSHHLDVDQAPSTLVVMAGPVRSYSREEFNALVADAPAPTADDVPVLADGRRLDTPEKVRAFVAEMRRPEPDLDSLDL